MVLVIICIVRRMVMTGSCAAPTMDRPRAVGATSRDRDRGLVFTRTSLMSVD